MPTQILQPITLTTDQLTPQLTTDDNGNSVIQPPVQIITPPTLTLDQLNQQLSQLTNQMAMKQQSATDIQNDINNLQSQLDNVNGLIALFPVVDTPVNTLDPAIKQ